MMMWSNMVNTDLSLTGSCCFFCPSISFSFLRLLFHRGEEIGVGRVGTRSGDTAPHQGSLSLFFPFYWICWGDKQGFLDWHTLLISPLRWAVLWTLILLMGSGLSDIKGYPKNRVRNKDHSFSNKSVWIKDQCLWSTAAVGNDFGALLISSLSLQTYFYFHFEGLTWLGKLFLEVACFSHSRCGLTTTWEGQGPAFAVFHF